MIERVLELVVPIIRETDGQRRLRESVGMPKVSRGLAREDEALRQLTVGNDLQAHFPGDGVVIWLQLRVRDLRRPASGEDVRAGFHCNAAVSQRSSTDTGGLRHRHAPEEAHVQPAVMARRLVRIEDPCVARLPRILRGLPSAAALQHEHAHAFFREPARRDRTPEAAADDDDVEGCGHAGARSIRCGSAAHAFFVDANVRGRIVAVVPPAGMVELDDMIGVVGSDRLREPQFADALPVSDRHP